MPDASHQTARRKLQEVEFFRFAQGRFPALFPVSEHEDLSGESPDIVVSTGAFTYGVEVTEIVDSTARVREAYRRKVCAIAQGISGKVEGISVSVVFHSSDNLAIRGFRQDLGERLASLVREMLAKEGREKQWKHRIDCRQTPLGSNLSSVYLHFMPLWKESRWQSAEAWGIGPLTPQHVAAVIAPKEARLQSYRARAKVVYLLVVLEGFRGSASAHIPEHTVSATYRTDFDGVLLVDYSHDQVHLLNTQPKLIETPSGFIDNTD